MTESEAIKIINGIDEVCGDLPEDGNDVEIALMMAKYALEEVEQYRAIGTVEELQKMKADYAEAITDWRQYKKIGTIESFRELTEKAEPKKPSEIDEREEESFYYLAFICPTCKNAVTGQPYRPNYCKHCGQSLNWE